MQLISIVLFLIDCLELMITQDRHGFKWSIVISPPSILKIIIVEILLIESVISDTNLFQYILYGYYATIWSISTDDRQFSSEMIFCCKTHLL